MKKATMILALVTAMAATSATHALEVNANITTDTTWTAADNPVLLKGPIAVEAGASLTIMPGTIVATLAADDGGIVVRRDAQIFVLGTKQNPVIMTSANDIRTWDGSVVTPADPNDGDVTSITTVGDPKTGEWRPVVQEWRNLTIMGNALISASEFKGDPVGPAIGSPEDPNDPNFMNNPTVVDGTAQKIMEGLEAEEGQENESRYGGPDDNDDSGVIQFLSMRYTGRVLGEGNELNGLSLGGVGSETDISYVDIMNNVDDGIEIWGGRVDIKYFNIWNIGDDSMDVDQGWRGRLQFGLIVQGAALAGQSQGSGTGDNLFETDGAEQSNVQPRTTSTVYNVTAIGIPDNGDGGTTWRDNARVQYRKCVFMDVGEELVRLDTDGDFLDPNDPNGVVRAPGVDGDGGLGYGYMDTHGWTDTDDPTVGAVEKPLGSASSVWSLPYNTFPTAAADNPGGGGDANSPFFPDADMYPIQKSGNLCEIVDTVFFDGNRTGLPAVDSGDEVVAVGVLGGSTGGGLTSLGTNVYTTTTLPIKAITRKDGMDGRPAPIVTGAGLFPNVFTLDPRAAGDALNCATDPADPNEGFWCPADYRGGFSEKNNWALGWTAADAFGFFVGSNEADDPTTTVALKFTVLTFDTDSGCSYVIRKGAVDPDSPGVIDWEFVTLVEGDGNSKSVQDVLGGSFDPNVLYDVQVQ